MVRRNSLPGRPSRRGGLGRGFSVAGGSSITATISAFDGSCARLRMRLAAQPVKLQFDNVGQFRIANPHLMRAGASRHPRPENTANIDIFGQIAPFQRSPDTAAIAPSGQIDENGSLPYKPRQLSAVTRSDRGGSFWAGNGPL